MITRVLARFCMMGLFLSLLLAVPLQSSTQSVAQDTETVTQRAFPSDGILDLYWTYQWSGPGTVAGGQTYATTFGYWVGSRGAATYAGEYDLYIHDFAGPSGWEYVQETVNAYALFGTPPPGAQSLKFKVRIRTTAWWGSFENFVLDEWTTPAWFYLYL